MGSNRELYTMFNEFLPIYYENAFIKYLDNKAILKYGEKPLIASRLKFEKEKDTNNVLIKLLELTKILKEKGEIGKEDIIDVLEKYTPENTTREDLWKNEADKIKEFCEEHFLGSETISGPVMYRLNNGLALKYADRVIGKLDAKGLDDHAVIVSRLNYEMTKKGDMLDVTIDTSAGSMNSIKDILPWVIGILIILLIVEWGVYYRNEH